MDQRRNVAGNRFRRLLIERPSESIQTELTVAEGDAMNNRMGCKQNQSNVRNRTLAIDLWAEYTALTGYVVLFMFTETVSIVDSRRVATQTSCWTTIESSLNIRVELDPMIRLHPTLYVMP